MPAPDAVLLIRLAAQYPRQVLRQGPRVAFDDGLTIISPGHTDDWPIWDKTSGEVITELLARGLSVD